LLAGALVVVFVYLIQTVAIPLTQEDGTSNYSGARKEAAVRAVKNISDHLQIDHKVLSKVHVEDVHVTTFREKAQYCSGEGAVESSGPADPKYYTVVMNVRDLFSYASSSTEVIYGCFNYSSPPVSSFTFNPRGLDFGLSRKGWENATNTVAPVPDKIRRNRSAPDTLHRTRGICGASSE